MRNVLMRLILTGSLSAICALPATAQTITSPPVSPVVIEAPSVTERSNAKDGDLIYQQAIRSTAGITPKQEFKVHFNPWIRKSFDLTIPAKTAFLATRINKLDYYCAAVSQQNSFWDYYEVAICLRDSDKNGQAEQILATTKYPWRIRTVYEMAGELSDTQTVTSDVPYNFIDVANLPKLELRVSLQNIGGFVTKRTVAASIQLCTPAEITVGLKADEKILCGSPDWAREKLDVARSNKQWFLLIPDEKGHADVRWGPLSFSLEITESLSVTAKSTRVLPEGPAILYNKGTWIRGLGFRESTPLFDIVSGQMEAEAPPS